MRLPLAFGHLHIRKNSPERRALRTACINAERNLLCALPQMEDAHLLKVYAVRAAFNTVIALSSAEAIPHFFYIRGDIRRGPVGIAVVCHDAAKTLVIFIFIFNGSLKPVLAVQIDCDAALVKAVLALELRLYGKREIFLGSLRLQDGRIVVSKAVIGALPEIRSGFRDKLYARLCQECFFWFPGPCGPHC